MPWSPLPLGQEELPISEGSHLPQGVHFQDFQLQVLPWDAERREGLALALALGAPSMVPPSFQAQLMPTSEASAQRECHSSWRICTWQGREGRGQCRFRKSSSTIAVSLSGLTCPLLTLRPLTSGSFLCPSKWSLRSVPLPNAHFLHHWLAPYQAATPPRLWE